MNNKNKDKDAILKELLNEYESQYLDKKTVAAIKNEWPDELKTYSYVKDPIELKKNYYIRYIDLKFTGLSEPYKIDNIEYGPNGSVLYVECKTNKIIPAKFFVFQTKHDKTVNKTVNEFIKEVYRDAGLKL